MNYNQEMHLVALAICASHWLENSSNRICSQKKVFHLLYNIIWNHMYCTYVQLTQEGTWNDKSISTRGAPLLPLSQPSNSLQAQER